MKWRHFVHNAKLEKIPLLFRSEIGIFDIYFKKLCEENFEDLQISTN